MKAAKLPTGWGRAVVLLVVLSLGLTTGVMATGYPIVVHRFYGEDWFGYIYGRVFTAWGIAGLIAPFGGMTKQRPFRYFETSPEIIRLAVMLYVRFLLSLRNVEDLLHERGIDVSHETVRF